MVVSADWLSIRMPRAAWQSMGSASLAVRPYWLVHDPGRAAWFCFAWRGSIHGRPARQMLYSSHGHHQYTSLRHQNSALPEIGLYSTLILPPLKVSATFRQPSFLILVSHLPPGDLRQGRDRGFGR